MKKSTDTIPLTGGDKGVHAFPKGINPKVIVAWLNF